MRVNSSWDNVSLHAYEHRELAPGEQEENIVLHFKPTPPEEIAATRHDRVIISLKHDYLDEWLNASSPSDRDFHMFDGRYRPYFEHRKAA